MKHSDRPIVRPKEDVLGRASFSLALAKTIDALTIAKDGFVIAVTGEWGSGKSSVIEMTLRYITHLEMIRRERLIRSEDLTPPSTIDEIEVRAEVYDRIRDKVASYKTSNRDLSKANYCYRRSLFETWLGSKEDALKAEQYWLSLQEVNSNCRTTQVRFSPWLIAGRSELATALLSELARALGGLGAEIRNAFGSLLQRLSELAPVAGAGLDAATGFSSGAIFSSGATISARLAKRLVSGPTLDELREELRTALRSLPDQRILIVIDDLDRLTPNEASEMVAIVKSLGDLPNVIYLLSYDQKNLARLICKSTKLDGEDYLKKIIQYNVSIPPITGHGLSRVLDADLSEMLGELSDNQIKRIGQTWHFVLRYYLKTPRDVRLFTNALTVALSGQRDFIDPVDMMLLEILRFGEPSLYVWIRENLDELVE